MLTVECDDEGGPTKSVSLSFGGLGVKLLTLGCRVVSVMFQGTELCLGYGTTEEYEADDIFLGATCGRFANRIAGASFELDGKTFSVDANNNGHCLHGGEAGFHAQQFSVKKQTVSPEAVSIVLSYSSPSGESGFPGDLLLDATFTLSAAADGAPMLSIQYNSTCVTESTPCSITNHTYWNLSGDPSIAVLDNHQFLLHSDFYTPVDEDSIPTGEVAPVRDTPWDFRKPKSLAHDAEVLPHRCPASGRGATNAEGKPAAGYDHNFLLRGTAPIHPAAVVYCTTSGVELSLHTSEVGLQLYGGNHISYRRGRHGTTFGQHCGFCLEPQVPPAAPNIPHFPSPFLSAKGGPFPSQKEQTIIYEFRKR